VIKQLFVKPHKTSIQCEVACDQRHPPELPVCSFSLFKIVTVNTAGLTRKVTSYLEQNPHIMNDWRKLWWGYPYETRLSYHNACMIYITGDASKYLVTL